MIREHDVVRLLESVEGLAVGSQGTVVHLYADRQACEVEFHLEDSSKLVTLKLDQVEKTGKLFAGPVE